MFCSGGIPEIQEPDTWLRSVACCDSHAGSWGAHSCRLLSCRYRTAIRATAGRPVFLVCAQRATANVQRANLQSAAKVDNHGQAAKRSLHVVGSPQAPQRGAPEGGHSSGCWSWHGRYGKGHGTTAGHQRNQHCQHHRSQIPAAATVGHCDSAVERYRRTANSKTCFIVLRAGALSEPALHAAMWHGSPTMAVYIIDMYCIR